MSVGVTSTICRWLATLDLDDVPPDVVERATLLILDIAGIAIRAQNESESTPAMQAALGAMGLTESRFRVLGSSGTYTATGAAMLNAANAHSLDFDDAYTPALLHASAPVVPAALAAAEMVGASGREFLVGVVAGLEVMYRVGLALDAASHYARGFYMTPTCGAFGATAAAARVMRLSPAQAEHAFGTVLSQTSGSGQFHANGAWTKRFQVGQASASGLVAASLARAGYTGASEALEGPRGFFRLYSDSAQPARAIENLGSEWEIRRTAFKPYPCCRHIHAAVDAAIAVRDTARIDPETIQQVDVGLCRPGLEIVAYPQDRKRNPRGSVEGQFSVHFCVAVALRLGRLTWDDFTRQLEDPNTHALTQRVTAVEDPRTDAIYPDQVPASIRVRTTTGDVHEHFVPVPRGEPENSLTPAELRAKFESLVEPYLGRHGADDLFHAVVNLQHGASVDDFFQAAAPRRPAAV